MKATQSDIVYNSDRILHHRGWGRRGAEASKLKAQLRGLYVNDNVLYYRLVISNQSNLNCDIDYVRYFVVDSKTAKLTARQEIELYPIYVRQQRIHVLTTLFLIQLLGFWSIRSNLTHPPVLPLTLGSTARTYLSVNQKRSAQAHEPNRSDSIRQRR